MCEYKNGDPCAYCTLYEDEDIKQADVHYCEISGELIPAQEVETTCITPKR